jgi:hypothetical protein
MLPEIQTPNQAILYGQRYSTHQKDYIYMTVSIIKQYYMVNGTVQRGGGGFLIWLPMV